MNNPVYLILAVFLLAIVVAWLIYYPVVNYAKRHNIYDNPELLDGGEANDKN